MKKLLLGSAAAVALTATGAAAQEWSASVGGFFTGAVAYIDADQDGNDFALKRDSEITFNFRLVADNGLTFGSKFELEVGDTSSDGSADFDEASAWVQGSFGRVEVGEFDGAADGPMGSGNVGADFVRAADNTGLLFDDYEGEGGTSIRSNGADTGDSLKVAYFTPSFAGFTAAISWSPSISPTGNAAGNGIATSLDAADEQNAIEIGAQYKGEFSGIGVQVGGGWVSDTVAGADDDTSFAGGAKLSAFGFDFGVNYGYIEVDESDHLGVGLAYSTGPWKIGADYGTVLDSDNANRDGDQGVAAGVSYSLAPGVVTGGTIEWADDGAPGGDDSYSVGLWLSLAY